MNNEKAYTYLVKVDFRQPLAGRYRDYYMCFAYDREHAINQAIDYYNEYFDVDISHCTPFKCDGGFEYVNKVY